MSENVNKDSRLSDPKIRGTMLVLLASLCLSTAPTVIKFGLNADVDPVTQLTLRLWIGALVLWIIFLMFQPEKLKIDRKGLIGCALAAGANTISLGSFYIAVTYIEISVATVIFSTFPMIALLLLALKGERITRLNFIRFGLALLGVYLLVGFAGEINFFGVGLVVITAIFFSLHITLIQWKLNHYPTRTITAYILSFMSLYMGIVYFATGHGVPTMGAEGWGVVIYTGLVATAIARFAMFAGIRHIGSGQTALLGPLETLMAVVWAMIFLDERLTMVQILGGLLILISAALASLRKSVLPLKQRSIRKP